MVTPIPESEARAALPGRCPSRRTRINSTGQRRRMAGCSAAWGPWRFSAGTHTWIVAGTVGVRMLGDKDSGTTP